MSKTIQFGNLTPYPRNTQMHNIEIDHASYQAKVKTKTVAELNYIISDARAAILANPSGPKAGYYADEISYAAAELRDRGCSWIKAL